MSVRSRSKKVGRVTPVRAVVAGGDPLESSEPTISPQSAENSPPPSTVREFPERRIRALNP